MGQKESNFSFSKNLSIENPEKKHKCFSIYFENIDREFRVTTNSIIEEKNIKDELRKFFKIPEHLTFNLKFENKTQADTEKFVDAFRATLFFDDVKNYLCDLEILLFRPKFVEYLNFQTFLFLPLKFFLSEELLEENKCKFFRSTDTLFSDPLDFEKSLSFYTTNECKLNKRNLLLAYCIQSFDLYTIIIYYKGISYAKQSSKFSRIEEIQNGFNQENNVCIVLCDLLSHLRIDEKSLLMQVACKQKLEFLAEDFEEYYKKINVTTEKPVFEILSSNYSENNKKALIDSPD